MLTFPQIAAGGPGIKTAVQNLGFPLVLKYLRDRGIDSDLIERLHIHILPASELIGRARSVATADDRLAAVFPHFSVDGQYIDWWSARLIDTGLKPVVHSFANMVPSKRGKMFCPPNEVIHGYLPPILDWRGLQKGDRVFLHESVIKAANGARLQRWSVGLNGVWGWTSRKHGMPLIQELRDLPWKALDLQPVICFDSNAADNWDVQAAISQLAGKLYEITGQSATHLLLPKSPEGEHWGFDDFCVRHGDDAALAYLDGDGDVVEVSELKRLKVKLNSEVCVVRSLGRIAEQATGTLMTRTTFTDINYAHYVASVDDKSINVPRLWLADPSRVEVEALDYVPGGSVLVGDRLNLWRGMGVSPSPGDPRKWLDLLERNIPNPVLRQWVIQWMAYPLQHLGAKLHSYIHLWGPPGSGKQALFYPLRLIYGSNAIIVGKAQLLSDFNSIYSNKQFINFDELEASERATMMQQKIKMLTDKDTLVVNSKGQPEYEVRNCANFISTSNYPDALKLDDDDRRACVIQFGERGKVHDEAYWTEYHAWVENGGAEIVFQYLLEVDLEGFNPKGWAPMTEAKADVTEASRSPVEVWVQHLWDDPESVLPANQRKSLWTNGELAMFAYADDPKGVTPGKKVFLGVRMLAAGFRRTDQIKINGKPERYWIVRNRDDEWGNDDVRHHLKIHS